MPEKIITSIASISIDGHEMTRWSDGSASIEEIDYQFGDITSEHAHLSPEKIDAFRRLIDESDQLL